MYVGSLGLIFLSFSINVKSSPSDGLSDDQSVPSVEDSSNISDSHEAPANDDGDDDDESPLFFGDAQINITLSDEFKNVRDGFSGKWNDYVLLSTKWDHTDLTWSVHNYAGFPEKKVDKCIRIATGKWAGAAKRLSFKQLPFKSKEANMRLEFVDYIYETSVPAIACSPGPKKPGNMKFTLGVHWTLNRTYGFNAACILTHEFGHALGLNHSPDTKAIMYVQAPCQERITFELGQDDKDGIQAIYPDSGGPGVNRGGPPGPVIPRRGQSESESSDSSESSNSSSSSSFSSSSSSDSNASGHRRSGAPRTSSVPRTASAPRPSGVPRASSGIAGRGGIVGRGGYGGRGGIVRRGGMGGRGGYGSIWAGRGGGWGKRL